VVYAGVVGAETGTPDRGKRLFDDDMGIVTVKEKDAARGKEKMGVS
jgi:hypothetical protein